MKKAGKLLIAGVLSVFMLMSPIFAATTYVDISNNWAKDYINSVSDKGLMKGSVSGGKTYFKPNDQVGPYECLIVIGRMLGSGDANTDALVTKWKSAALTKYNVPEWAYNEIAFCLERGIISTYDLESFKNGAVVQKKDIVLFLGRGMGVTETTGDPATLPYKDKDKINALYVPHILYLLKQGVLTLNPTGDTNFNPGFAMDRATFAKMIDTASDAYGAEHPTTSDTTVNGTFVNAVSGNLTVAIPNATTGVLSNETYTYDSNLICTIDGQPGNVENISSGDKVAVTVSDRKAVKVAATSSIDKTKGTFVSTERVGTQDYISIRLENNDIVKYPVNAQMVIVDNNPSSLSAIKEGYDVELKVSNGVATFVQASMNVVKNSGEIMGISFATGKLPEVTIKMDDTKELKTLTLLASTLVKVDGKTSDAYGLKVGMQLTYTMENDLLTQIEGTTAPEKEVINGMVTAKDAETESVTIEFNDGKTSRKVNLSDASIIRLDGTKLTYLDILIGDNVSMSMALKDKMYYASNVVVLR